eukprot:452882-Amorphochlora_amoeboformis.AAC.1
MENTREEITRMSRVLAETHRTLRERGGLHSDVKVKNMSKKGLHQVVLPFFWGVGTGRKHALFKNGQIVLVAS